MTGVQTCALPISEDTRRLYDLARRLGVYVNGRVIAYHDHNERDKADGLLDQVETGATVLDDSAGYWIEHSGTLYGRAKIVAEVAPFGTVVCSMTAAWVWLGGPDFPSTIDVISTSHFRSASVSRRIRVFKRLTLPEQIIKLGGLPVTTPARTACDLVMSPEDIPDPSTVNALVCQLMSAYQFRPNDCLQIVKEHRHHKYAGRARMFFESVQQEMDEPALEQCA